MEILNSHYTKIKFGTKQHFKYKISSFYENQINFKAFYFFLKRENMMLNNASYFILLTHHILFF